MDVHVCMRSCCSRVQLFVTAWTVARQAPLSMGIFRQEYCSGLLYPPPGDLPNPGIESTSLVPPALAGGFFTKSTTWEVPMNGYRFNKNQFSGISQMVAKGFCWVGRHAPWLVHFIMNVSW